MTRPWSPLKNDSFPPLSSHRDAKGRQNAIIDFTRAPECHLKIASLPVPAVPAVPDMPARRLTPR